MTNGELCTQAIVWTGARTLGSVPSANEMAQAMLTLESMLASVLVSGRRLTDVLVTESYEAGEDERIFDDTTNPITVTMPVNIVDAKTGLDRAPKNGAVVKINGTYRGTYVYIAYLADWTLISDLAQAGEQPLGPEFDEALAAMLAVRLAPSLKTQPNDVVVNLATAGRRLISRQFRQVIAAVIDPVLIGRRCHGLP